MLLTLSREFPTHVSQPLGTLDTFSRVWRPTQTAYLPLSSDELELQHNQDGVSSLAPRRPKAAD